MSLLVEGVTSGEKTRLVVELRQEEKLCCCKLVPEDTEDGGEVNINGR